MSLEKRMNRHYFLIQGLFWIIMACSVAYVVPILQSRGFSSAEIGVLNSARYLTAILFQPLIAGLVDRAGKHTALKNTAAVLLLAAAADTALFLVIPDSFLLTLAVFLLFGMTLSCMPALVDALAMQLIGRGTRIGYSAARGMGSATFAVACVILGNLAAEFGMDSILVMQLCTLLLISCAVVLFREGASGAVREEENCRACSLRGLLRSRPKYAVFLAATVLMFLGRSLSSDFLIEVVRRLGGTTVEFGYCQFVLAVSEIPVALLFVRYRNKLGIDRIVVISALFNFLKIAGIALAKNLPVLIAAQAFQSLGCGAFWSASVFFVLDNVEKQDLVKGQSLVGLCNVGIGSGVGGLLSGAILQYFGLDALLHTACAAGAASLVLMLTAVKSPRNACPEVGPGPLEMCSGER